MSVSASGLWSLWSRQRKSCRRLHPPSGRRPRLCCCSACPVLPAVSPADRTTQRPPAGRPRTGLLPRVWLCVATQPEWMVCAAGADFWRMTGDSASGVYAVPYALSGGLTLCHLHSLLCKTGASVSPLLSRNDSISTPPNSIKKDFAAKRSSPCATVTVGD